MPTLCNVIFMREKYMPRTTITLPKSLLEELMFELEAKSKMEFLKSADELRHEDERLG